MADDGETKDDVKVPDGEVGEKIEKLFVQEEKDTSEFCHPDWQRISGRVLILHLLRCHCSYCYGRAGSHRSQGGSPWLDFFKPMHYDTDLLSSKALPFPLANAVCLKYSRICWVLGVLGLHSNGRCVGRLYLDTSSYWLHFRAFRASYFLCYTRYYHDHEWPA
jgi:hypothetical protein